jgi:hypothetical protein
MPRQVSSKACAYLLFTKQCIRGAQEGRLLRNMSRGTAKIYGTAVNVRNTCEDTKHLQGHGTPDTIRNTCQDTKHLTQYETPVRTRNTSQDTKHFSGHEHLTRYGTPVGTRKTCQDTKHLSGYPISRLRLEAETYQVRSSGAIQSTMTFRFPYNAICWNVCTKLNSEKYSQAAKQSLKTNMNSTYLTN